MLTLVLVSWPQSLQTSGLCVASVSMMLTFVDLDSAPAAPNSTALPGAEDRSKKAEHDTVCSDVLCGILDCIPGPETPNTTFFVCCGEVRSREPDDDTGCSDVMCGCLACVSGPETPNTSSCLPRRFGARNLKMISVAMLSCGGHLVRMCAVNKMLFWNTAVLGGEGWCLQAAITTPAQTTALLRLWAPPKHQYNVIEGATCDCSMSDQGTASSWTCSCMFKEGYQHTRTREWTTLNDLRRHRHERSKQHKYEDKESDTKIEQDTRLVPRRVRVWEQPSLPEHAQAPSEARRAAGRTGCLRSFYHLCQESQKNHPGTAALLCVRSCVCVRTSRRTRGGFWRCTENVWTLAAARVFLVPSQRWCSSSRQMHSVCKRFPVTFPNSTPQGFGKDLWEVTIDDALLSTHNWSAGHIIHVNTKTRVSPTFLDSWKPTLQRHLNDRTDSSPRAAMDSSKLFAGTMLTTFSFHINAAVALCFRHSHAGAAAWLILGSIHPPNQRVLLPRMWFQSPSLTLTPRNDNETCFARQPRATRPTWAPRDGHREMRTRVQLHTGDLILSQMPSQQQILDPSGGLTICRKRDKQRSSYQKSFRAGVVQEHASGRSKQLQYRNNLGCVHSNTTHPICSWCEVRKMRRCTRQSAGSWHMHFFWTLVIGASSCSKFVPGALND